jgi:hypothetical protein
MKKTLILGAFASLIDAQSACESLSVTVGTLNKVCGLE